MALQKNKKFTIRHLSAYDEYRLVGGIQKETWGDDPVEFLSPSLLAVTHKIGGVIAAAFSEGGEAIGFVYGLPGKRHGKDIHWSHMLAVLPSWRGNGVGFALKKFQKEFVLSQGIRFINWTYDPLESINANLNITRLGAIPVEYACNLYGDGTFSKLSRLIGTDRLIVTWFLQDGDKHAYLSTYHQPPPMEEIEQVIVDGHSFRTGRHESRAVRIRVPASIQQLKTQNPESALAWRNATRLAFQYYFELDYTVCKIHQDKRTGEVDYILTAPLKPSR